MVVLRADPWRPDFGAEVEAALDEPEDGSFLVDAEVETADWSAPIRPVAPDPLPLTFVDGVRRVDLRVLAEDEGRRAWGLLGSFAVGSVRCDGSAAFGPMRVGRALVVGGRIRAEAVSTTLQGCELRWDPFVAASERPLDLVHVLHDRMREAEGALAQELCGDGIVVADGPLHYRFREDAVVVGLVKRMLAHYLDEERASLLPRLLPGERTPMFGLGRQVLERYAWYQRLVPRSPTWHDLSAIVRCEVRMSLGLEAARRIADHIAVVLPAHAGRPGIDPRAPQNLTPVGALETRLRHRLGHAALVRRTLQVALAEAA